jgi:hypothetical protein
MPPVSYWFTRAEAQEYLDDEDAGEGWYARLSASGYLDCTEYQGPFPRAWQALRDVCRTFDVDINGNDYDGDF